MNPLAAAVLVCLSLGQTPAHQPGASLAGTVTSLASGARQPVSGAIVTLRGDAVAVAISIATGTDGTFAFDRLPAGRYTIAATKPAYLATIYGATRADPAGTPVVVSDGERRSGIALDLPRGGVIAGAVRDESGAPAAYVNVSLYLARTAAHASVDRVQSTETDDRGAFRFFGLQPDDYLVAASTPTSDAPPAGADVVDRALDALRRGVRVPIEGLPRAPAMPPSASATFAPIFYPGTASVGDAAVVSVAANDERSIDFALQPVVLTSIRGIVSGAPPGAHAQIQLAEVDGIGSRVGAAVMTVQADDGGRFVFSNLPPAVYRVSSRMAGPASPGHDEVSTFVGGSIDVRLNAGEPSDVVLDLQPTLTLRGRVRTLSPTAALPRTTVGLLDVDMSGEPWRYGANLQADGTFLLTNLLPGRYRADVRVDAGAATPWHVVSASIAGRDALDEAFDFGAPDASQSLVVTLSDRPTELRGRLELASGGPPSAFQIVAFATDESRWASARRVRAERAGVDGTFSLRDLPAGDYFVGVITADFADDVHAPDVLRQLAAAAVRVTVRDGETVTQNLRVR